MDKKDFPIFKNAKFRGSGSQEKDFIYLDSSATTQKPRIVINEIKKVYENYNANVFRGLYRISEEATSMYEKTREDVATFINADPSEIIFTKNTTESLNMVIYSFAKSHLRKGDNVLLSEMEHHSNIVPWQILQKEIGFNILYLEVDKAGNFTNLDLITEKKPKIVSIVHVSNVLGVINDVNKIIKMAKSQGSYVIIDGAQAAGHINVDVKNIDCDFYCFSAHKMMGPTGVGILYGKKELLDKMEPLYGGGEMILSVSKDSCTFKEAPYKFEAGTPNFVDVIAFRKSIEYINDLGVENIHKYIKDLSLYAHYQLSKLQGVEIYGNSKDTGIISFNIPGIHPHDIATFLDEDNIAIRAGHHCAQILMRKFNVQALSRASLYIYNDKSDVDAFVKSLSKIIDYYK
jgi:cysteine desulfurase/selenocysteine lyase